MNTADVISGADGYATFCPPFALTGHCAAEELAASLHKISIGWPSISELLRPASTFEESQQTLRLALGF